MSVRDAVDLADGLVEQTRRTVRTIVQQTGTIALALVAGAAATAAHAFDGLSRRLTIAVLRRSPIRTTMFSRQEPRDGTTAPPN